MFVWTLRQTTLGILKAVTSGPHHRPHQLMASSSLDCHRLVEWGRHNDLEASMVGSASSHVLGSLIEGSAYAFSRSTWADNIQCILCLCNRVFFSYFSHDSLKNQQRNYVKLFYWKFAYYFFNIGIIYPSSLSNISRILCQNFISIGAKLTKLWVFERPLLQAGFLYKFTSCELVEQNFNTFCWNLLFLKSVYIITQNLLDQSFLNFA